NPHALHRRSFRRQDGRRQDGGRLSSPAVVTPRAATTGQRTGGWRAWATNNPKIRMFQTLVRREIWEHRSLWMAPLAVTALLLICALLTHGALKIDATD